MDQISIRNVSGSAREVPLPDGGYVVVGAGETHAFDAAFAAGLEAQPNVWRRVAAKTSAKTPAAPRRGAPKSGKPAGAAEAAESTPAESGDDEVTDADR